jgi:hypothetical protein
MSRLPKVAHVDPNRKQTQNRYGCSEADSGKDAAHCTEKNPDLACHAADHRRTAIKKCQEDRVTGYPVFEDKILSNLLNPTNSPVALLLNYGIETISQGSCALKDLSPKSEPA